MAAAVVVPPTHVYSHLESNFATIFLPHLMAFCSASSVCTWMSCARASSSFLSLSRAEATSYKMLECCQCLLLFVVTLRTCSYLSSSASFAASSIALVALSSVALASAAASSASPC